MKLASAEKVVRDAIAAQFVTARVVTKTPGNLADVLPVIRVKRIRGSDSIFLTIDEAIIDVNYYDATYDAARSGSEDVREFMRFVLPGTTISNAFVLTVKTDGAPVSTPYDNTNVERFTATYLVRLETQEAS